MKKPSLFDIIYVKKQTFSTFSGNYSGITLNRDCATFDAGVRFVSILRGERKNEEREGTWKEVAKEEEKKERTMGREMKRRRRRERVPTNRETRARIQLRPVRRDVGTLLRFSSSSTLRCVVLKRKSEKGRKDDDRELNN